jgi:hypothetical protein
MTPEAASSSPALSSVVVGSPISSLIVARFPKRHLSIVARATVDERSDMLLIFGFDPTLFTLLLLLLSVALSIFLLGVKVGAAAPLRLPDFRHIFFAGIDFRCSLSSSISSSISMTAESSSPSEALHVMDALAPGVVGAEDGFVAIIKETRFSRVQTIKMKILE